MESAIYKWLVKLEAGVKKWREANQKENDAAESNLNIPSSGKKKQHIKATLLIYNEDAHKGLFDGPTQSGCELHLFCGFIEIKLICLLSSSNSSVIMSDHLLLPALVLPGSRKTRVSSLRSRRRRSQACTHISF